MKIAAVTSLVVLLGLLVTVVTTVRQCDQRRLAGLAQAEAASASAARATEQSAHIDRLREKEARERLKGQRAVEVLAKVSADEARPKPPPPAPASEADRAAYAKSYEDLLFARHMNPDSVAALGAKKTTLHIEGWFCTRQFHYDFANGKDGDAARSVGFTRLECGNAMALVHGDL